MKSEGVETRSCETCKVVDLGFLKLWRDDEGIIHMVYSPNAVLSVEEVKATSVALREVRGDEKRLVLVDARGFKYVNREARIFSIKSEAIDEWIIAMATIITPVSKILADLFMTLNKPRYPIKYFTSEDEALEWLRGFLDKHG